MPHRVRPPIRHRHTRPLRIILYPFQRFSQVQASSGILLLVCTVVALAWSNSPWGHTYREILDTKLIIGVGDFVLAKPLLLWINDGLMSVFFFVVGLEIKREVIAGELASPKRAALPIAAALGGMAAPATIYAFANVGTPEIHGWGVPMATDIAFAVGILALLGPRVPVSLKVFLTALAIVDDIGAVAVIALFYGHSIALSVLAAGLGLLVLSLLANHSGVRSPLIYALIGAAVWVAFLKSGIHATVAGVLLAMTVPASTRLDAAAFRSTVQEALRDFVQVTASGIPTMPAQQQAAIASLERACEEVQTPLQRMETILHPWVSFCIMPIFALANAGVHLAGMKGVAHMGVPLGVVLGLVIGKPLGITLFSGLAVKMRLAEKPDEMTWRQLHGAGWVGGIGFTMALFIAGLAFNEADTLAIAKVSILGASTLAGLVGYLLLRTAPNGQAPAKRRTEAEA